MTKCCSMLFYPFKDKVKNVKTCKNIGAYSLPQILAKVGI